VSKVVLVGLHIGRSLASDYSTALGGVPVRTFTFGGTSGAYDEDTGLASRYPTLEGFLRAEVPEWESGDRLVLVAFSAGCWAPRYWMKDAGSRALLGALVLLDGLHSGLSASGGCKLEAIDGVVQFAREANRDPSDKLLVLTHTAIAVPYASTTLCADLLEQTADGRGMHILGFPGTDADAHNAQQREVGPQVLRDLVHPWLNGELSTGLSAAGKVALLAGGAAALYALVRYL
jgi:hypothetical protein